MVVRMPNSRIPAEMVLRVDFVKLESRCVAMWGRLFLARGCNALLVDWAYHITCYSRMLN